MGAKIRPIINKVGSTAFGVNIGCHAFNRCCLNAVSTLISVLVLPWCLYYPRTCWPLRELDLFLLGVGIILRTFVLVLSVEDGHRVNGDTLVGLCVWSIAYGIVVQSLLE